MIITEFYFLKPLAKSTGLRYLKISKQYWIFAIKKKKGQIFMLCILNCCHIYINKTVTKEYWFLCKHKNSSRVVSTS